MKQFLRVGWRCRIARFLGVGGGQREYENARRLQELGIPTAASTAFSWNAGGSGEIESQYVTRTIDGETIHERIEREWHGRGPATTARARRRLTRELARILARLHSAGIEHRDLHERNLHLAVDVGGRDRWILVDLGELRTHWRMTWRGMARDLRRLGRYLSIRTTRTDRLRFFGEYWRRRGFRSRQFRAYARAMEDETIESRAEFWRRRDCRSASAGRDIQRRRRGNHEVMMTGGVPDWLVERCLRDASGVLESYVVRRLKEGAVPRASEIEIEGRRFVWKSYPSTGWRGYFAGLFRRDAAMRAWCNAKALSLREIPTPRAVLLARRRRMGVPVESHLLTELVDAEPLLNYVHRIRQQLAPPERRRATRGVVLAAARLLRLMHDRRVTHHDLKASNVLATAPRDLAHPELWLVDLDSAQTWLRPPERERIQNIGRLAASFHGQDCLTRADYLRFVRTYLGGNAFRQGRWKPLWRRVRVWVERKVSPRKPAAWADRSDSRSARD